MMKFDRATIIIADIEKYLSELEELNVKTAKDLHDKKNYYAVSMILLTLFNLAIDLGQEIVLSKKLGVPATYAEIFSLMKKAGIINSRMSIELKEMVRVRNRLSHEYFAFTEEDVLLGIKRADTVKRFLDKVLVKK